MKDLNQIKFHFEHPSFAHRVDFIDEYDFQDNYFDYYLAFLKDMRDVKDHLYLSELIDLAAYLDIYDEELYERYVNYLHVKQHYIVKLAVLDYLMDCEIFYNKKDSEQRMLQALDKSHFFIVKNQILTNLVALSNSNEKYIQLLVDSLDKTKDWRSIYRVISKFINHSKLSKSKILILNKCKNLHKKKNFGEGVDELLGLVV